MQVRHTDTPGKSGNFRSVPRYREEDRRVAQYAEVVSVMGVLPNVFAGERQIFSDSLTREGADLCGFAVGSHTTLCGSNVDLRQ